MLAYAEHGDLEAKLAYAYIADAFVDIVGRLVGREAQWGVDPADLASAHDFVAAHRDPAFLEALADELPRHGTGPRTSTTSSTWSRDTFHRFAEDKIRPVAEHIHRTNADIPDEIIDGMAEIGGFGLSVPEEYGGFAAGGESDYLGDVRRHRGALVGLARRRRLARSPGPRSSPARIVEGRHRGAEARRGSRRSRPASASSA